MKSLYYFGMAGLILFELANVYFIMPMPGSQRMESLETAFAIYQGRWICRGLFILLICLGMVPAFRASFWVAGCFLAIAIGAGYLFNVEMAADKMFLQPHKVRMTDASSNQVNPEKLVLGIALNGEARAYPIQFMGYHHQVLDSIGGAPVMVTYCTVCRTGRAFSPTVNGKSETFRLVGMDHFNAMFEDAGTHSWWRQATGEAVVGSLKGTFLPEIPSTQTSLKTWLQLYPNSLIMQRDDAFAEEYDSMDTYDLGIGRGKLTRTDTASWKDKSWVVGIALDRKTAKAFDWNRLKVERMIQARLGEQAIVLVLASDHKSFAAFKLPDTSETIQFQNDTLYLGEKRWDMLGRARRPEDGDLTKVPAYQEFWHSWQTFHPYTTRY
jgi:hypothetical protein